MFFNNTDLGTLDTDESATAGLAWDRANHTFIVRVTKTKTTPSVVEGQMPYYQSDSTPPTFPMKAINVGGFSPNCTSGRTFTAMEATFDKVRVNASAVQ